MIRPFTGRLQVYQVYINAKNYYNFNGSVNVIKDVIQLITNNIKNTGLY
jgi:hypothetical protein